MSTAGEPVRTSEQVRVMAEELDRGAERCKDPEHRARLRRRAEQLRREYAGDDGAPDAPAPSRQDQQQHHRRHGPPRGPHGPGPDRPRGA